MPKRPIGDVSFVSGESRRQRGARHKDVVYIGTAKGRAKRERERERGERVRESAGRSARH